MKVEKEEKKVKNYKVYVIGSARSYGSWIEGRIINNMEEADVVVLTGGEDISPKLYNEPVGRRSCYGDGGISIRDAHEVSEYNKAVRLGKVIWGTCRGAQLICAMTGGKLIQDMSHSMSHKIYFYDKAYECTTNTLHHQMAYPYLMPKEDYFILANSHGHSKYYLGGDNLPMNMPEKADDGKIKEPEFVYYPKVKGLGIQGHPEMMRDSPLVTVCQAFLNLTVEGKIDQALALNIPVKDIIRRAWDFKFTKEENAIYKQLIGKTKDKELVEA